MRARRLTKVVRPGPAPGAGLGLPPSRVADLPRTADGVVDLAIGTGAGDGVALATAIGTELEGAVVCHARWHDCCQAWIRVRALAELDAEEGHVLIVTATTLAGHHGDVGKGGGTPG